MTRVRVPIFACALGALTACASHGGSAPLPSTFHPMATVDFVLTLPKSTAARIPAFVSSGIASISITVAPKGGVAGPATVANCSSSACAAQVSAPVGDDTFTVAAYSGANAQGNLLSTGSATGAIALNAANSFTVTFNPVVATVKLHLVGSSAQLGNSVSGLPMAGSAWIPAGTASNATLQVDAYDASGALILSPGQYLDASGNPLTITITNSDTSGRTALSAATVTGGDAGDGASAGSNQIQIAYNGAVPRGVYPAFSASAPGYSSAAMGTPVTLEIAPTVAAQYTPKTAACGKYGIADGPDGRIWYAQETVCGYPNGAGVVGAWDPSTGTVTEFADPSADFQPVDLTAGSDGNLWVLEAPNYNGSVGAIAKVTPAGTFTEYSLATALSSLTAKGTVNLAGGAGYEDPHIVLGADGNVYTGVTLLCSGCSTQGYLVQITPTGAVTAIPVGPATAGLGTFTPGYGSSTRIYWTTGPPSGSSYAVVGYYDTSTKAVTTLAQPTPLSSVNGIGFDILEAGSDGFLYVNGSDSLNPSTSVFTPICTASEWWLMAADGEFYSNNLVRYNPLTNVCQSTGAYANGFTQYPGDGEAWLRNHAIVGPGGNFWQYDGTNLFEVLY